MRARPSRQGGFSLVIVAVMLAIAGVLLITLLPTSAGKLEHEIRVTSKKIQKVTQALNAYYAKTGTLPVPASLTATPNSSTFGIVSTCGAGVYCNSSIDYGGVPTRTLGLPDESAFDEWGNRLSYVMSSAASPAPLPVSDVAGNHTPGIIGLVISHGPDSFGAFVRAGSATQAKPCASGSAAEQPNCVPASLGSYPSGVTFIKDYWSSTYDDLTGVVYKCPADVTGCAMWLDANDLAAVNNDNPTAINGDSIAIWKDKSGNNNNMSQATSIYRPTFSTSVLNSKPVITFTTAQSMAVTNLVLSPKWAVSYVGRLTGGANQRMLQAITNNWLLGTWGGGGIGYVNSAYYNGNIRLSGDTADTAWRIYSGGADGTTAYFNSNGTLIAQSTSVLAPPVGGLGLNVGSGGGEVSNMQVAEIAAYPTTLSFTDQKKIECYMATKWGVTMPGGCSCPAGLDGCSIWLDATNINNDGTNGSTNPSTGTTIASWVDRSGFGNNFTASSTAKPTFNTGAINSKPTVTFNGSTNTMQTANINYTAFAAPNAVTVFAVENLAAVQGSCLMFWDNGSERFGMHAPWTTDNLYFDAPNTGSGRYSGTVTGINFASNTRIVSAVHASTSASIYINGTLLPDGAETVSGSFSTASLPLYLGSCGGSYFMDGQLAEYIVYPAALNDTERKKIECYLGAKWGVGMLCY